MSNRQEFTDEQEWHISSMIDRWYYKWKSKIAPGTHYLGAAKEELKMMFCKDATIDDHIASLWFQAEIGVPGAHDEVKAVTLAMVGLTDAIRDKNDTDNNKQVQQPQIETAR